MRLFFLWVLFCVFFISAAKGDVVTISPVIDNTLIQANDPLAQLSNGRGDIFVGRTNQDGQGTAVSSVRRGLLAFDIGSLIPSGSTIDSVSLSLTDQMGQNGSTSIRLHRTLESWGEGASFWNGSQGAGAQEGDATWLYRSYNSANPSQSVAWSNPGGSFLSSASAATIVNNGPTGQTFVWTSSQMIEDVQFWLDNPQANYGWTLIGNEAAGQTVKRFRSSETLLGGGPKLTVEFTAIPEPSSIAITGAVMFVCTIARRRRFDQGGQRCDDMA